MQKSRLVLEISRCGNGLVVVVASGDCDLSDVADLESALMGSAVAGSEVGLDLSGVTFIDTGGLHSLLVTKRALDGIGSRLVLVAPSPAVMQVLALTRLDDSFEVRDVVALANRARWRPASHAPADL